jgi:hypothetical protein
MNPSRLHGASQNPPAPPPWPILLALGITLFFVGMFTNAAISILGGVLCFTALVGRLRSSLPLSKN